MNDRRDERAALAALTTIAAFSPRRLRLVLAHHTAAEAIECLAAGRTLAADATRGWTAEMLAAVGRDVAALDPPAVMDRCETEGITVLVPADPHWPAPLLFDEHAPSVLFARGDVSLPGRRRVGIVGTRNATAAGRATADELGEQLALAGVAVVSGLARGIDGAAHRGVRRAGGAAIGVVGSGLDVQYPRQNTDLWRWVGECGLLLTEWPPGAVAEAWHFPLRNRIIAALSELLVVVESRERGGSLITVEQAERLGIDVMAVPGSTRNRAAAGTNVLISQGAKVVTSVEDVLVALGFDHLPLVGAGTMAGHDGRRGPHEGTLEARVFELCADRPCTLDDVVNVLRVPVHDAAMAAARLERDGWLVDTAGWFEPAGSKLRQP